MSQLAPNKLLNEPKLSAALIRLLLSPYGHIQS